MSDAFWSTLGGVVVFGLFLVAFVALFWFAANDFDLDRIPRPHSRGKWITKNPKEHDCRVPSFDKVGENSIWECHCGKAWTNAPVKSGMALRWRLRAERTRTEKGTGLTEETS